MFHIEVKPDRPSAVLNFDTGRYANHYGEKRSFIPTGLKRKRNLYKLGVGECQ